MNELTATELEGALLETLAASDVVDIPAEVVDTVIQMPILSVLKKLAGGVYTVRDHLFRKKILRLISRVAAMPATEREEAINRILATPDHRHRFAEQLLLSLERFDDMRKAAVMGNLSVGLLSGQISLLEFWRMNRAVEAIALDEEWPVLRVIEDYKALYYPDGQRPREGWRHEGVLLDMVNRNLRLNYSDGDLRSIIIRANQTGLFGCLGWRQGPAHDCELSPWYFKLKPFMHW